MARWEEMPEREKAYVVSRLPESGKKVWAHLVAAVPAADPAVVGAGGAAVSGRGSLVTPSRFASRLGCAGANTSGDAGAVQGTQQRTRRRLRCSPPCSLRNKARRSCGKRSGGGAAAIKDALRRVTIGGGRNEREGERGEEAWVDAPEVSVLPVADAALVDRRGAAAHPLAVALHPAEALPVAALLRIARGQPQKIEMGALCERADVQILLVLYVFPRLVCVHPAADPAVVDDGGAPADAAAVELDAAEAAPVAAQGLVLARADPCRAVGFDE